MAGAESGGLSFRAPGLFWKKAWEQQGKQGQPRHLPARCMRQAEQPHCGRTARGAEPSGETGAFLF